MKIRPAEKKDIGRILVLLGQVLDVHVAIRPDIFAEGSTKYGPGEIEAMLGKLSVGALARTIFLSLAEAYKKALDELENATGKRYDALHVIGGGCQNALLNELTARATGKKVTVGPVEATAIGNLIAQMIGTGEIKDLSTARETIKHSFDITEVKING